MITAKHAARSPWAEKMELLPLLIDPMAKAHHLLDQENSPLSRDIQAHQKPSEKLQLLYQLADQMSEMVAILAEHGEEVPALIKPGVYRYLSLIDLIIEDREQ